MSLHFAASHIQWRQFEKPNQAPVVDAAQLKLVRDFVNGFFHSHDHPAQAQDALALGWYAAHGQSFRIMLKQVVGELASQVPLSDLNMVMLTHWTPDVEVGCSVTNAIIHETGCLDAFGMAISDHGLSSAFLALQVIEDYLEDNDRGAVEKKALLLIADQDAILYDSPSLAHFEPAASACAVMLRSLPRDQNAPPLQGMVFKHYRKIPFPATRQALDELLVTLQMFTPEEDRLPLLILTTPGFAAAMRESASLASQRIESWDERLLSCAPWARLEQLAPSDHRILMMLPEGDFLTCAGFVAGA